MGTFRNSESNQPIRTDDFLRAAAVRHVHTNFLSEADLNQYLNVLKRSKGIDFICDGGYEEASRKIISAYPAGDTAGEPEALCVRITDKSGDKLTHRDYLGALMALGVKRDLIGDIVTDDTGAFVFCTELMSKLIVQELDKVGSHGVSAELSSGLAVKAAAPERRVVNVNSMRIDCLLAAAINKNRDLCKQLVESGSVKINGTEITKPSREVSCGDSIYINKFGKYKIGEQLGKSTKERLFVELFKY